VNVKALRVGRYRVPLYRIAIAEDAGDQLRHLLCPVTKYCVAHFAGAEDVAVRSALESRQPILALGRRNAIEYGDRYRHVLFEVAE
jgi:hypothetical protein